MQKIQKKQNKIRTKKFTLSDHQWQTTFITLNNNGFCLLSIQPPQPAAINPKRC